MGNERRHRLRSCVGKVCHPSKADAKRAAAATMTKWGDRRMTAYKCRHCGWHHVGHADHV